MPQTKPVPLIILQGLLSLAIAMGVGRFAFTPLFPMMVQDGLIGLQAGSLLAAANFLGYWIGALSATVLRLPPRMTLSSAVIATGLVTAAMGLTESFPLWLILRWLAGLFSAWTLILVSNHLVRALAEAGAIGLQGRIFSGVGLGIIAAGLCSLAFMVTGLTSAQSWIAIGVGSLLLALLLGRSFGAEVPVKRAAKSHINVVKAPLVWRLVFAYGAMGFGYVIPATYLPIMAKALIPDPLVFGWSWPAFGLAAALSTAFAGKVFHRFGNRKIWGVSQIAMAIGLALPVLLPGIASIIAAGLLVGGTFMLITMAGMKESHVVAPPADAGRHVAVLTAALATGQMIGPPAASFLHGLTGDFSSGLILGAALLAVTALPLFVASPQVTSRGAAPAA